MKTMYPPAGHCAMPCASPTLLLFNNHLFSLVRRLQWLLLVAALMLTQICYADYTVAAGTTVNAGTIIHQSGVLTVNGTLTISANTVLGNFTTIVVNAPSGRISWTGNVDLTLQPNVSLVIAAGAPGLQPVGGSAARRLIVGTIVMAVSNSNSNNAIFSFSEMNNAGGLPQFTLAAPASICAGSNFTATLTALNNSITYNCSFSITPATLAITPAAFNNFNNTVSTSIAASVSGTYTITCRIYKAGDADLLAVKTSTVEVMALPATPAISITGSAALCAGSSTTISASSTGNTIYWYNSPDAAAAAGSSASNANWLITPTVTTSYYAAAVGASGCTSVTRSAAVTITVDQPAKAGNIIGGASNLCSGNNSTLLQLSNFSGTISRWEYATDSFKSAGLTIMGNGSNLQVDNIGATTYYRVVVSNGACGAAYSNMATISVITPGTWLGVNSDWNSVDNWCNGVLPDSTTNVQINTGVPFYPVVMAIARANNIQFNGEGATLVLQGGSLKLYGSISSNQQVDAREGTIELAGASPQSIIATALVNRTVSRMVISTATASIEPAGGMLSIRHSLSFGNINDARLYTNNLLTLLSNAAATASLADITNGGSNSGNSISGSIVIERFIPALRKWRLLTAPVVRGSNVSIAESWQEGAAPITDPANITSSNNPNPGYGAPITFGLPALNGYDQNISGNASIFYITSKGWTGVPLGTNNASGFNTGNITDQQGYMIFIRGNRSTPLSLGTSAPPSATILRVKGPVNQGRQLIPLGTAFVSGASRFRAIGNPYPSAINFHAVALDTANKTAGFADAYYLWDANVPGGSNAGGWVGFSYNYNTGSYDKTVLGSGSSSINTNGNIESGMAFMIDYAGTANNLVIDETHKTTNSSINGFRTATTAGCSVHISLSKLQQGKAYLQDAALVTFHPQPAEAGANLAKIATSEWQLAVMLNDVAMAIARRGTIMNNDSVLLLIGLLGYGQYRLELEALLQNIPAGTQCTLHDAYTGKQIPLAATGNTTYHFTVDGTPAASNGRRFTILFTTPLRFTQAAVRETDAGRIVCWQVNNDDQVATYEIEYALKAGRFCRLATLPPAAKQYALPILAGDWQCRIKAVTETGIVATSEVLKLIKSSQSAPVVFPNPSSGKSIQLKMGSLPAGTYQAQLITTAGMLLEQFDVKCIGNNGTAALQPTKELAPGTYQLVLKRGPIVVATIGLIVSHSD